jgi:hypothetical protein
VSIVDVYGEDAPNIPDTEWLAYVGEHDYVVLKTDKSIRYTAVELAALSQGWVRAFLMTNGNLKAQAMIDRYEYHRHRILQRCRKRGPYIHGVYEDKVEKLWP